MDLRPSEADEAFRARLREWLAIDGSRDNHIVGNTFSGNSAGGIFLYKNCGEFATSRPERWFQRRYGADGNLIEHNTFTGEDNGVWIGSRMSENVLPMQCSDPQYQPGFSLDYAADDTIRDNVFQDVTFGVRIEDDRAVVAQAGGRDRAELRERFARDAEVEAEPTRALALGSRVEGAHRHLRGRRPFGGRGLHREDARLGDERILLGDLGAAARARRRGAARGAR